MQPMRFRSWLAAIRKLRTFRPAFFERLYEGGRLGANRFPKGIGKHLLCVEVLWSRFTEAIYLITELNHSRSLRRRKRFYELFYKNR